MANEQSLCPSAKCGAAECAPKTNLGKTKKRVSKKAK